MCSFSYLEPVCCSMSSSNYCFLTCIQVSQEAGQVVWYFHLFQNFPQLIVIHTVKGFGIVIELFNFSFFSVTGWGIDVDYCDIEWFALVTNRDHSVVFEIASKYCIWDSFVDYEGYSISSKGFLPTVPRALFMQRWAQ